MNMNPYMKLCKEYINNHISVTKYNTMSFNNLWGRGGRGTSADGTGRSSWIMRHLEREYPQISRSSLSCRPSVVSKDSALRPLSSRSGLWIMSPVYIPRDDGEESDFVADRELIP
ncbi:hypothetical protein QJS10_CPA09g00953 [Acorus calamus]|uniref:Uncharacterized protein n=1 Tax=Acorus calamus TaxID=4465 RepID=A0AAV9E3F0_ACOCL|nr:hypothetical protein QJS10_CPA09g00953 [Acorus calamus]